MFRYYYQENPPKSDEIDWEMFIQDENDRENIGKIDEYRENHPDIPQKAQSISKYGHVKPCILDELYASDNMTHVICIACGLLFFYGKIFLEYYFQKK